MNRKINRVGQNTLTISLPSKWTKHYDLQAGEELNVEEDGNQLIISTSSEKSSRSISMHIAKNDDYMNRIVCAPFLKGYDEINLSYDNQIMYAKILGSLKLAVGFEVVEQSSGKCKLAEISRGSQENFGSLIIRLFHVIRSFIKEVQVSLKSGKNLIELKEYEYTADRLSLHCRRLINKNIVGGKTYEITGLYHVVCLAEQISDQFEFMLEYFSKSMYKYDPLMDILFDNLDKSLEIIEKKINNYLTKKDPQQQYQLSLEQKVLRSKVIHNMDKFYGLEKENIILFHHLASAIDLVQHMSEELY